MTNIGRLVHRVRAFTYIRCSWGDRWWLMSSDQESRCGWCAAKGTELTLRIRTGERSSGSGFRVFTGRTRPWSTFIMTGRRRSLTSCRWSHRFVNSFVHVIGEGGVFCLHKQIALTETRRAAKFDVKIVVGMAAFSYRFQQKFKRLKWLRILWLVIWRRRGCWRCKWLDFVQK